MEDKPVKAVSLDEAIWMSANAALKLVAQYNGSSLAARSILNRSSSGMLLARARLFRKYRGNGSEDVHDDTLPSDFWHASQKGSDWAAGDFTVQVSDRHGYRYERWQAFGVMFERAGIEAMLARPESTNALPEPTDRPSRQSGRRAAAWWPHFAEELAIYLHEEGMPDGTGAEGQSEVIDAIFTRMNHNGKTEPSRATIQPVVTAVLRRIRTAGN